ncbi:type II secretion system minor pseudopilin GspK [Aquabacterium sp.]|uniref:type II secretion system minor pseudopilin GspK n=1 Tax=Aquabacterium sp. TaxID=1872578 RepID=UPI002486E457|nr:type II secretion system minor pseudopilin GspK [Aquabacterium sp.]MDI1258022.1 type II secretion system minor pseudopilin GspK [Aquabacterium sp.]
MRRSQPSNPPARQRGAALLMAMVIVTVVATIASSMVWQQWRAVQVESAERGRQQSEWLLVGALDFARLVLKDDGGRMTTAGQPEPTHLAQQWAQDLKEMRLSTFLAVDKDNTDDAPDAFLSGKVLDINARYNLRNLLEISTSPGLVGIDQAQLSVLRALFTNINLPPDLATQIAEALKKATLAAMDTTQSFAALGGPSGRAAAPLMPQRLDQLTWLLPKLGADTVERMRPYVALLPYPNVPQGGITHINVNTAPKEVIAAVWGIDTATAERIVRARQSHYFEDDEGAKKQVPATVPFPADAIKVTSEYFEVTSILRLENQIMKNRHLVKRSGQGRQIDVIVMNQERFSGVDPGN